MRMGYGVLRTALIGLIVLCFLSGVSGGPALSVDLRTGDVDESYILPRSNNSQLPVVPDANSPPYTVETSFRRWLKHYKNPVVCDMIFCHGSCADYDDSCPSFRHHVLTILDEESSCNSKIGPNNEKSTPGGSCHVDNSLNAETFSAAGSPFK